MGKNGDEKGEDQEGFKKKKKANRSSEFGIKRKKEEEKDKEPLIYPLARETDTCKKLWLSFKQPIITLLHLESNGTYPQSYCSYLETPIKMADERNPTVAKT